jgi:hypothetical protein
MLLNFDDIREISSSGSLHPLPFSAFSSQPFTTKFSGSVTELFRWQAILTLSFKNDTFHRAVEGQQDEVDQVVQRHVLIDLMRMGNGINLRDLIVANDFVIVVRPDRLVDEALIMITSTNEATFR